MYDLSEAGDLLLVIPVVLIIAWSWFRGPIKWIWMHTYERFSFDTVVLRTLQFLEQCGEADMYQLTRNALPKVSKGMHQIRGNNERTLDLLMLPRIQILRSLQRYGLVTLREPGKDEGKHRTKACITARGRSILGLVNNGESWPVIHRFLMEGYLR